MGAPAVCRGAALRLALGAAISPPILIFREHLLLYFESISQLDGLASELQETSCLLPQHGHFRCVTPVLEGLTGVLVSA